MSRILRLPDVKSKTGLCRSSIYARMANGQFPQSIDLGERSVGWLEDEIDQWIEDLVSQSRKHPPNSRND